jgi:hypothetical protein
LIDRHPTRNIDLDLLLAALELPAIDALFSDPDLHAAVSLQITGMGRAHTDND